MPDPGLMPLPDAAADLDWSNLVDAAKAYEGESQTIPAGPRVGREQYQCSGLADNTCVSAQPEST